MASKKIPAKRTTAQIKTAVASAPVESPIEVNAREEALKSAATLNYEKIVSGMSSLSAEVGKTFSNIQQQFLTKVDELSELDRAIKAKTEQLQILLDIEEINLDLRQVVEEAERAQRETAERRAEFDRETAQYIAETRRSNERSQSEYLYQFQQRQQADKDEHARKVAARQEELEKLTKEKEAAWKERESLLASMEAEYNKAIAEAAAFPEKLSKEVSAEVAKATNSLKKDLTYSFGIEKKDLESQLALERSNLHALQATVEQLRADNQALRNAVAEAQSKVVEIAKGGFDSVSKQLALDSVMNMSANKDNGVGKGRS